MGQERDTDPVLVGTYSKEDRSALPSMTANRISVWSDGTYGISCEGQSGAVFITDADLTLLLQLRAQVNAWRDDQCGS